MASTCISLRQISDNDDLFATIDFWDDSLELGCNFCELTELTSDGRRRLKLSHDETIALVKFLNANLKDFL